MNENHIENDKCLTNINTWYLSNCLQCLHSSHLHNNNNNNIICCALCSVQYMVIYKWFFHIFSVMEHEFKLFVFSIESYTQFRNINEFDAHALNKCNNSIYFLHIKFPLRLSYLHSSLCEYIKTYFIYIMWFSTLPKSIFSIW